MLIISGGRGLGIGLFGIWAAMPFQTPNSQLLSVHSGIFEKISDSFNNTLKITGILPAGGC
jgi:hypothetical protein